MARQPRQVHIYLFRQRAGQYEYAIFQRADMPFCWQGVCGGLEGNETLEEGARREVYEEAGIIEHYPLYALESVSYLPDNIFKETTRQIWGNSIVVVPIYFFAMPCEMEIMLSEEHSEVRWLPYQEAYDLVYYQDQKTALYELNERLIRNCGWCVHGSKE